MTRNASATGLLDVVERRYLDAGRSVVAVVVSPGLGAFKAFVREVGGERIATGPTCDDPVLAALGLAMIPTRLRGTEGWRR